MKESEKVYINSIEQDKQIQSVFDDLQSITAVYTVDKFERLIKDSSVVLLDTAEDLHGFALKVIDDEIEELKSLSQAKKFVHLSEAMLAKVPPEQEFYTIIIQPYLIVQLKESRDEFIKKLSNKSDQEENLEEKDDTSKS